MVSIFVGDGFKWPRFFRSVSWLEVGLNAGHNFSPVSLLKLVWMLAMIFIFFTSVSHSMFVRNWFECWPRFFTSVSHSILVENWFEILKIFLPLSQFLVWDWSEFRRKQQTDNQQNKTTTTKQQQQQQHKKTKKQPNKQQQQKTKQKNSQPTQTTKNKSFFTTVFDIWWRVVENWKETGPLLCCKVKESAWCEIKPRLYVFFFFVTRTGTFPYLYRSGLNLIVSLCLMEFSPVQIILANKWSMYRFAL